MRALENFGIAGADLLGLVITDTPPPRRGDAYYTATAEPTASRNTAAEAVTSPPSPD